MKYKPNFTYCRLEMIRDGSNLDMVVIRKYDNSHQLTTGYDEVIELPGIGKYQALELLRRESKQGVFRYVLKKDELEALNLGDSKQAKEQLRTKFCFRILGSKNFIFNPDYENEAGTHIFCYWPDQLDPTKTLEVVIDKKFLIPYESIPKS